MYKKTMTYEDYNGIERTEDFYFNLNKAEIAEMELTKDGGFANYIQKIVAAKKQSEIVRLFKRLLLMSFGEKSDDGRRFIKSRELSREFEESAAFPEFYMLLATDEKEATAFVNGITPDVEGKGTIPFPSNG